MKGLIKKILRESSEFGWADDIVPNIIHTFEIGRYYYMRRLTGDLQSTFMCECRYVGSEPGLSLIFGGSCGRFDDWYIDKQMRIYDLTSLDLLVPKELEPNNTTHY